MKAFTLLRGGTETLAGVIGIATGTECLRFNLNRSVIQGWDRKLSP